MAQKRLVVEAIVQAGFPGETHCTGRNSVGVCSVYAGDDVNLAQLKKWLQAQDLMFMNDLIGLNGAEDFDYQDAPLGLVPFIATVVEVRLYVVCSQCSMFVDQALGSESSSASTRQGSRGIQQVTLVSFHCASFESVHVNVPRSRSPQGRSSKQESSGPVREIEHMCKMAVRSQAQRVLCINCSTPGIVCHVREKPSTACLGLQQSTKDCRAWGQ